MMKAIKHKAITLLMFACLALFLCGIGWLIVLLYDHGSSAAFQIATGLLMSLPYIAWIGSVKITQRNQGGAE